MVPKKDAGFEQETVTDPISIAARLSFGIDKHGFFQTGCLRVESQAHDKSLGPATKVEDFDIEQRRLRWTSFWPDGPQTP
jgi:hypothetical protein